MELPNTDLLFSSDWSRLKSCQIDFFSLVTNCLGSTPQRKHVWGVCTVQFCYLSCGLFNYQHQHSPTGGVQLLGYTMLLLLNVAIICGDLILKFPWSGPLWLTRHCQSLHKKASSISLPGHMHVASFACKVIKHHFLRITIKKQSKAGAKYRIYFLYSATFENIFYEPSSEGTDFWQDRFASVLLLGFGLWSKI